MNLSEPIDHAVDDPSIPAFFARATMWSLGLFGLIRVGWIDQHLIDALVEFQKTVVFWYGTTPNPGIAVNSSCSGADVMALCAGVLLAYPIAWPRRIAGAVVGVGMILVLNDIRIASLHAMVSAPATLNLFHLYIWPAILTFATVLFVFVWSRAGERRSVEVSGRWRLFALTAAACLIVYAFAAPWALSSSLLHQAGVLTASVGAAVLGVLGAQVQATGNVVVTTRGAFQVTPECLFTPMLPVYVAAVFAVPLSRRRRIGAIAVAPLLFFVLGVARLLALALPPTIAHAPVVLVHGFYQLIAGAVLIIGAVHLALRTESAGRASARSIAALGVGVAAGAVAGPAWAWLLLTGAEAVHALAPWTMTSLAPAGDPQGALALLPSFQLGLLTGLWLALTGGRRWRSLGTAMGLLAGIQLGFLCAVGALAAWWALEPHALVVRGFAIAGPVGIALALWRSGRGTHVGDPGYQRFWHDVGESFPSLTGAASTAYYFESEKRLIAEAVPSLANRDVLKTDLWDEAKNTRILLWVADQGARVYGVDISEPIARQAQHAFADGALSPVVTDVRRLPFCDGSFDVIYSMGTIEHFAETEATVAELARLLRPGGRLILGVPNRHDPFLRPLMVAALYRLGLYAYGYEKSYSRRRLRQMMEAAGLDVGMESGLLFMPGWLRMLDLWCHTSARPLAAITGALVRPFVWLDRHVPQVRRHGYLLASVGVRPASHAGELNAPGASAEGLQWQSPVGPPATTGGVATGTEYVIDARGCSAEGLQSMPRLQQLFASICADLRLHPLAPAVWHAFAGHGGVTGIVLLSESHLTIHTYPESG
ncbi:MAG: methyltransferase domain-containing protein, partial [Vicinamibacterales bacterium]